MATIYAKLNCISSQSFSNNLDGNRLTQEIYANLFNFLDYLRIAGITELVTRYSGYEFWDATGSVAGSNAFSVWKFKSTATRPWDWYLYIHNGTFNSGSYTSPSNIIPTRIMTKNSGGTPVLSTSDTTTGYYGVFIQAAFSISGSSSTNPWNGTVDLTGNATKTTPVWNTGSDGYSLHVFPRINNISGSAATEKDAITPICKYSTGANANTESKFNYHFWSDGDGLLFMNQAVVSATKPASLPANYGYSSYIGPFKLLDGIIAANSGALLGGTGSYGFCMMGNNAFQVENAALTTHIWNDYTNIGNIVPGTGTIDGGFFIANSYGVRVGALGADSNTNTTTFQPNPFAGNRIDGRQYVVYATENIYSGTIGYIDNQLFRVMGGSPRTHDITSDGKYIIMGTSNTANNRRLIVPWTSSAGSAGTGSLRAGTNVTITNFNF